MIEMVSSTSFLKLLFTLVSCIMLGMDIQVETYYLVHYKQALV